MTQLAGSMAGRTVLVTGATDGIGEATVWGWRRPAHMSRSPAGTGRTEAAARRLRAAGNGPVETFVVDMSDQSGVRGLADEILQRVTLSSQQGRLYRGSRPAAATRAGMVIRGLSVRKQGG
jgi:NAD(P)-dependent dehydrogenase (short-subunit alcohol dehydrogenase family)